MQCRFFTDTHLASQRTPNRPLRFCEQAFDLIDECVTTCPPDYDLIIFGGDSIQRNPKKSEQYHIDLLKEFKRAISPARVPFQYVSGNHEHDCFGDFNTIARHVGLPVENTIKDTVDGHRLIFINDAFHQKGIPHILPFSQKTLDFVQKAVDEAPTRSITLFTHTPINDFDHYIDIVNNRDGDSEYIFRPNAKSMRDILENSGKNCLVVTGHSHYEICEHHNNIIFMGVQSLVEGVETPPQDNREIAHRRWADITRNGESDVLIRLHGYDSRDIILDFNNLPSSQNKAAPDQTPSLAAE